MKYKSDIINAFTLAFDQCNASLLNRSIYLIKKPCWCIVTALHCMVCDTVKSIPTWFSSIDDHKKVWTWIIFICIATYIFHLSSMPLLKTFCCLLSLPPAPSEERQSAAAAWDQQQKIILQYVFTLRTQDKSVWDLTWPTSSPWWRVTTVNTCWTVESWDKPAEIQPGISSYITFCSNTMNHEYGIFQMMYLHCWLKFRVSFFFTYSN